MTVVVADTSPLNYLIILGEIDLLPRLYGKVVIPFEVLLELSDEETPRIVYEWARVPPEWLEVRPNPDFDDPSLSVLDAGERCAILLAKSEPDVLLLIDEAAGRSAASRLGIPNTGTVGILRAASIGQLLDLPSVLARLSATNFRISKSILDALLAEDTDRRRQRAE